MASLRQLLYKFVPKELIERPKMGFGVEALLSEHRLKTAGIFDVAPVRTVWHQHLLGRQVKLFWRRSCSPDCRRV